MEREIDSIEVKKVLNGYTVKIDGRQTDKPGGYKMSFYETLIAADLVAVQQILTKEFETRATQ